ncbi:MAG: hypothetical protein O2819_05235 [Planctomycetota bacterium]|nr:hypothetical protein [Planctomycetota bacterium]
MEIEFLDAAEARARLKPLDISIAADELGVTGIVIGDAIASSGTSRQRSSSTGRDPATGC